MNLSMVLAALALVPQPQKTVEQGESTERTASVGKLRLVYANGSSKEFRVRTGCDVGDWTSGRSFENALRAWTAYNDNTQVSLSLSAFDLVPRQSLKSIVFTASGECPWMVVKATAADGSGEVLYTQPFMLTGV